MHQGGKVKLYSFDKIIQEVRNYAAQHKIVAFAKECAIFTSICDVARRKGDIAAEML